MNIAQLTAEITKSAESDVLQIKQETANEVRKIQEKTAQEILEKKKQWATQVKRKEENARKQLAAQYALEKRLAVLRARQELMQQIFVEAQKQLETLPKTKRTSLMNKLWKHAKAQTTIATVETTKKDKAFFSKKAKVSGVINCLGGFIAYNKDKTVSIDMRFDTLLANVKHSKTSEIAKVLFDGR